MKKQNYICTKNILDNLKKDQIVYADDIGVHFHFVENIEFGPKNNLQLRERHIHLHRVVVESLIQSGVLMKTDL